MDDGLVGRMLLRIEGDLHREGWDKLPALYVLVDADAHPDTAALCRRLMAPEGGIRINGLLAQMVVRRHVFAGLADVGEGLLTMAQNLAFAGDEHEAVAVVRAVVQSPGMLGFAFASEMWHNASLTPQEWQRVHEEGIRLADVPGSRECRKVVARTIDGRIWLAQRERGRKPVLLPTQDVTWTGRVATALGLMCDTVRRDVPRTQEEFDQRYSVVG